MERFIKPIDSKMSGFLEYYLDFPRPLIAESVPQGKINSDFRILIGDSVLDSYEEQEF